MKKAVKTEELTNEQNIGIISSVYEFIKEELSELKEIIECRDPLIYYYIGRIQYQWYLESCHSLARNYKKILNNQRLSQNLLKINTFIFLIEFLFNNYSKVEFN